MGSVFKDVLSKCIVRLLIWVPLLELTNAMSSADHLYSNTVSAGHYVVCFDPLDGSSNLDAGISTGSIFGEICLYTLITQPGL